MESPREPIGASQTCQINAMDLSGINQATENRALSTIKELQQAMGTAILTHSPKYNQRSNSICSDSPSPIAAPESQWNGTLELFSFPRELRDRIYFHYLYRPSGVLWSRQTNRCFPFEDHPDDITSLFLTSHQVYAEAFAVFCRYNNVRFFDCRYISPKRLDGLLRLFPEKPARMLQCIGNGYWSHTTSLPTSHPGPVFLQILRDAHTLKAHFPKLRVFHVRFGIPGWKEGGELAVNLGWSEDAKVEKLLGWMKGVVKESQVVPPWWIQWQLLDAWQESGHGEGRESAMNRAYGMLVREFRVRGL